MKGTWIKGILYAQFLLQPVSHKESSVSTQSKRLKQKNTSLYEKINSINNYGDMG